MIVAGIGSRKGVGVAEVIAAVEAALEAHGLAVSAVSALATTAFKQNEEAIFAAGRQLGLPVIVVEDQAMLDEVALPLTCLPASSPRVRGEGGLHDGFRQSPLSEDKRVRDGQPPSPRSRGEGPGRGMRGGAAAKTLSHSDLSLALAGTPSVSETAALAAAGQGARLLGPRLVLNSVTCALATNGDAA